MDETIKVAHLSIILFYNGSDRFKLLACMSSPLRKVSSRKRCHTGRIGFEVLDLELGIISGHVW